MTGLEKFGYFLLGLSGGMALANALNDLEARKPVGEIEEWTSKREDDTDAPDIQEKEKKSDRKPAKEKRNLMPYIRADKTPKTDYKSMYERPTDKIADIVELPDSPSDDEPVEDDPDEDLVKERVEEWIEVYLDENPQEFIPLVFYMGDETLCDDREQLISNPEEVVGEASLLRLAEGGPGAENGVIFIRNLKTMLNYEVVLDAGKYSETVLGIFEKNLDKEEDDEDVG